MNFKKGATLHAAAKARNRENLTSCTVKISDSLTAMTDSLEMQSDEDGSYFSDEDMSELFRVRSAVTRKGGRKRSTSIAFSPTKTDSRKKSCEHPKEVDDTRK